jgi:Flp pilus assembly protein TadG
MSAIVIALKQRCTIFFRNDGASVIPTFAVALLPLLALMGASVDYSGANRIQTKLQAALDAAVLAGAHDDSASWASTAANTFNATFQSADGMQATPSFVMNTDGSFTGSVNTSFTTSFLGIVGVSSINVNASATAMVAPTSPGGQYCMVALNQTAQPAVQVSGNGNITITAPNCVMQVNSNASPAVSLNGNASINTTDNCYVGTVQTVGNSTVTPMPDATCKTFPDPFANWPKPTVTCDPALKNFTQSNNNPVNPGTYCGGMNFSGNVNVTFNPGTYIIQDGVLQESGGTFTGNGVTLFLTGTGAGIQMSGKANWHLVAPSDMSQPFPGFVIYLDPSGPTGLAANSSSLSGQSELYFEGIVYLPGQQVNVSGTAEAFAPSPWTSFIADTFKITGNGSFVINNNTGLTSVPIPTGLQMRTGGRLWLTQ